MTDLKSCPFCGSEAKITDTEPYAVECANEGCQIDGPCHGNKAEAIAAWNRRASPAPSSDLVERLRNAMDGVTPGPWEHDGGDIFTVSQECCNLPRVLCDTDPTTGESIPYGEECCGSPNIEQGLIANTSQTNAAYIALCSPDNIGALLDENAAQAARIAEQDGELAGQREALEELAGEIENHRDAITHPHGQRAHFIDSQDQIRVDVLTDILDRAGVALGGAK